MYAVCSAHTSVLEAAAQQAMEDDSVLHVESTSSQVNQDGGYTGQTPGDFAAYIARLGNNARLGKGRILLGGDHLGPFPWRNQAASSAMAKGAELVRACVQAGYQKIHLDASMPCAGDPPALEAALIAERAAILAESAEQAFASMSAGNDAPLYVIGTEVPAPGGETAAGTAPAVTTADHVRQTLEVFRTAFAQRGLSAAWERVIALVVQPGVEFGDEIVFSYGREAARPLVLAIPDDSAIIYEAHSTDYQPAHALRELVEDHFAILKVGPWLTFAYREAIFALSLIERELLSDRKGVHLSEVRKALEEAMLRNPVYWRSYYDGDAARQRLSRAFSYSDRCRYYWPEESVQHEVERLFSNLQQQRLPATLLSQYLPLEYEPVLAGVLKPAPQDLTLWHIRLVLRTYAAACRA